VNAETSIAAKELPSNPLDSMNSSQPALKISRKKAINFVEAALQVAVAELKAAPIPNLCKDLYYFPCTVH
jgi:hypothetical protein